MQDNVFILGDKTMRSSEAIKVLIDAGFSKEQAVGLASAMMSIQSGQYDRPDVVRHLQRNGFSVETAAKLTDVFFKVLAAA